MEPSEVAAVLEAPLSRELLVPRDYPIGPLARTVRRGTFRIGFV